MFTRLYEYPVNAQAIFSAYLRWNFAVANPGTPSYCWGALKGFTPTQDRQRQHTHIGFEP